MSRSSRPEYREVALEGLERPENGVTVVVASYRPPEDVLGTLLSLAGQTLDPNRFEVVLVVNGLRADDVSPYEPFAAEHPHLQLRILRSPLAGACHSLNLGIQAARMNWTTFVDDDDTVSPRYLEGLLAVAGPGVIPLTMIDDVHVDGRVTSENRLNDQIRPLAGRVVPPEDCPRGISFNASKLIPTDWARATLYDTRLSSGQDIAFYGAMYARYNFDFAIVPVEMESTYFRALSDTSQSRRQLTFGFAVDERLDVIDSLAESIVRTTEAKRPLLKSLMRSQALFIRRYLEEVPEQRKAVNATARARGLDAFPWDVITRGTAKNLVVSVCFPPFSDASAVTVSKRIANEGAVVDVISADMSAVRPEDPTLGALVSGLVGSHTVVPTAIAFGDWASARHFSRAGWEGLERRLRRQWPYRHLYSRAMWPASHILAALIKARRPETQWTAEFSDPLSRTVQGSIRLAPFETDDFAAELVAAAASAAGIPMPSPGTLFEMAEFLPYALADELVFTNQNQLDYMLGYCPSPALAQVARAKATLRPHPVPDREFYELIGIEGPAESDHVNLAYFGGFYANRSLGDLFAGLSALPLNFRRRLRLHLYTDDKAAVERAISEMGLFDVVSIRPSVPYLHFLNLTTRYDCLVVNDTATAATHPVNPYLPSKWSDYAGSGTDVWTVVEPGSTMAGLPATYSSRLGHIDETVDVLQALAMRASADGLRVDVG